MAIAQQEVHSIVLSDIHLSDAEIPNPRRPLWKKFKQSQFFVDPDFRDLLEQLAEQIPAGSELVLNGDILDFDSVMAMPSKPAFRLSWVERLRGLAADEPKSLFKLKVIIRDHPVFFQALREWILKGHSIVWVIGNHDMELHWPSVQAEVIASLRLPEGRENALRFCEFFYISQQDTLIEHGNQYDPYCLCHDPIHPLIREGQRILIRVPFGNLAGKLLLNGIGLMNPHVDSSFIKGSIKEYLVFFYRYLVRSNPLLFWTWFWGAAVTLVQSLGEGLLPALKDPLTVEARVEGVAARSETTPRVVRELKELHVHPAIFHPLQILQELWLDRALLIGGILYVCFQLVVVLKLMADLSLWWFFIPLALLLPPFIFYARSVESQLHKLQSSMLKAVPMSARIAKVNRVVHGHLHKSFHTWVEGVEHLNPGTWSPAFEDVECTKPYGRKCFVWIKPKADVPARYAELHEWKNQKMEIQMPEEVKQ